MAINDIVAATGDTQSFIVEIPSGNATYTPDDVLIESDGAFMCTEIPVIVDGSGGGGNIFIMSE